ALQAGRHAAMRRGAVLERAVEGAKALLDVVCSETRDAEGFDHRVRLVIADAARGQLVAVADEVVLVSLDLELFFDGRRRIESRAAALGQGERVMREVDLLLVLVPFVEREVHDPGEFDSVLAAQVQLAANPLPGEPGELVEAHWSTGHEEAGVAHFQAELIADSARSFRTDVLGDRAGTAFLALAPEDVTKARLALALRPGVHAVAEGAAAAAGSGHRPDADLRVFLDHAGEDLEARATEVLGHILHLDRVAQGRPGGAVLAERVL